VREEATRKLQDMLDDVARRLEVARKVRVAIVPRNPHFLSVEPPATADGAFLVSVEEALIDILTTDELRAALAHELGHVWIFTHHPYLQTERLANDIAMRVVTRDALAGVYGKIWERDGKKGNLAAFLGE
jgi:predicted Zn-dependent protease